MIVGEMDVVPPMEAGEGSRTPDTVVRSHVLCPLSYTRRPFTVWDTLTSWRAGGEA